MLKDKSIVRVTVLSVDPFASISVDELSSKYVVDSSLENSLDYLYDILK